MNRCSPATKTGLLAAGLALISAGAAAPASDKALVELPLHQPGWLAAALAAVLFCIAELHLLHAEFRRQAYSFTLAGVPLVMSLLLLPGHDAVLARLAGAAVAFGIQRPPLLKASYNLCAYAVEVSLDVVLLKQIVGLHPAINIAVGLETVLIVAAVDALMGALVLLVISFHQERPGRQEARAVLLPALCFSLGCSSLGLAAVLLLLHGVIGAVLLLSIGVVLTMGYRGYQILHRRHEALTVVHQFVTDNAEMAGRDELAARLISRTRSLMRAGHAELVFRRDDQLLRLKVDEHDRVTAHACGELDWLLTRVQATGESMLLPGSTRDGGLRHWLQQQSVAEALIVPLPGPNGAAQGVLLVADRLGETATFTDEDTRLLQTIAAHLAVAIRNTQLVDRLRHDAHHDSLTDLPNRAYFNQHLDAALRANGGYGVAVLLLDLDRFKEVNDTLGHHVGDQLLVVLGQRLAQQVPGGAVVSRLGGDEFAVLLRDLPLPSDQHALAVAKHIASILGQPVVLSDATLSCQVSVGVGLGAPGLSAADVLRHADTAMYSAKAACAGAVAYTPELDRGRAERLALLADLHLALDRDELRVLYQPKLDLNTGRITGAEALVRWQHPRLGLLSPDVFVPLAESTGLIDDLTMQVLRKALTDCRHWQDEGHDLTVAVNLSGRVISDSALPERIGAALAEAGLHPHRLVLEITESSALAEAAVTIPVLNRLAGIGVTLSLDDFGTGYSSLAYLHRLPVREIKIDKSFVRGLQHPTDAAAAEALVSSTISIAKTLKLRTVAEGIEDADILQRLRALGCGVGQGFLISRPGTSEDLQRLAREYAGNPTGKAHILLPN